MLCGLVIKALVVCSLKQGGNQRTAGVGARGRHLGTGESFGAETSRAIRRSMMQSGSRQDAFSLGGGLGGGGDAGGVERG